MRQILSIACFGAVDCRGGEVLVAEGGEGAGCGGADGVEGERAGIGGGEWDCGGIGLASRLVVAGGLE